MLSKYRIAILGSLFVGAVVLSPLRPLKVTGHSMEPTLHDGEIYLLDQFYWQPSGVRRNDIGVVKHAGETWVKRLAGMPGDQLEIVRRPDGWIVELHNLTVEGRKDPAELPDGFAQERTVGPNEIFIIGDNLNRSTDSTNQEAGAFRIDDIVGVVRSFSFSRRFQFRRHR
jgi:signal peptidase I